MDELGFNKIAAAVLVTALGFMGLKEISHSAMHISAPEVPAYRIAVAEVSAGEEEIELPFPQPDWIAAMDESRGAKVFKKCTSCHNAEDGGANGTGPNLWNVVGASAGVHAGFNYSSAMTNSGLTWDYETLNAYLEKPTRYLSGTAMNFVGLKKDDDRAAVIEYLRVAATTPVARPEPAFMETSAEDSGDTAENIIQDGMDAVGNAVETTTGLTETLVDQAGDAASDALGAAGQLAEDVKEAVTTDTPEDQPKDE